ncbi:helix-turn-helix transcriptional regulator [Williamsia muralis]|uniref:helix-turn-helix domain-containing protein n=1 Tax=Williamsia marianensis TaxID=85044 RepID=UPI003F16017F
MADDNLGAYLRARRNAAAAESYPFATHTARRVPGLRREEVAELAGLSTDYYVRLEQGREKHPSEQVVAALSAALKLTKHQDDHLRLLAGLAPQAVPAATGVDPALAHMLDSWTDAAAFVLDPLLNFTQMNPLAAELFSGFSDQRNLVRNVFLDPEGKRFFVDWQRAAESSVGSLRATMHLHPSAGEREALIAELRADRDFERLWQKFDISPKTQERKLLRHAGVGDITIDFHAFGVMSAPGQQLVVYQPDPGSTSEARLLSLRTQRRGDSAAAAETVNAESGVAS